MTDLVVLWTSDNLQGRGVLECQYSLECSGSKIHAIAASNLHIPVRSDDRVYHFSGSGVWQLLNPKLSLSVQDVVGGDSIFILPVNPDPGKLLDPGYGPPRVKPAPLRIKFSRLSVPGTIARRVVSDQRPLSELAVRLADFPNRGIVGNGSLATVYKSVDPRNGEAVAVKTMIGSFENEKQRVAFDREVSILASVNHPTLLGFRGFVPVDNPDGDPPAIVTSFMSGGSLENALESDGLDVTSRFVIIYGVAVGMMVLHGRHILHRDLKPANVLLDENGDPHVADFGISKVVEETCVLQSQVCGAPMFLAPELLGEGDGALHYSFPVDVYAFAVLMYLILVRRPYVPPGIKAHEIAGLITKGHRPEIPASVHENFRLLMHECWAPDPGIRPTFEQIVVVLEKVDYFGPDVDAERVLEYRRRIFQGKLLALEVSLADYPKIDNIGRGAFGLLYRARDPHGDGFVAVKVIREGLSAESLENMFQREVEVLASVNHPTLLEFRGFVPFWRDDPPAILTEYMERGSMQAMLSSERRAEAPADWNDTTRFIVLYGVAVAMMVLHENRILHRDLKPDNVLLNSRLEPRVADFGLSKFVEAGATMMQTVQAGTVPFMAPEIYEGANYAFPVDVYAYGVLLYVSLTGQDFFPGIQNAWTFGAKIRRGDRPPIPSHVSRPWRELIERCWAMKPESRPTFYDIVCWYGTPFFVNSSIDVARFLQYQKSILSEEFWSDDSASISARRASPVASVSGNTQLDLMRLAADAGDPYCANTYGCRLRDGVGLEADVVLAAAYFRRSAEGGDAQGMINWAACLEFGRGVAADLAESAQWYKSAMDKGDSHGTYCYAEMLEYGRGVPKNERKAAELYKAAAEAGHDRAQAEYGKICEFGHYGVPASQEEAVRYYRMASDQGSPDGMMFFADMLEHGKGVPQDIPEAIRLYRLAATRDHSKALGCLGFKMVAGNNVPQDVKKGKELIERQIALGDPVGLLHLARIAEDGIGGPVDLEEAFRRYAMAAAQGLAPGIVRMARMMMLGKGTRQSTLGAMDMYRTLIEKEENTDAMASLGLHFLHGEGVKRDVKRGVALIRRAANLGNRAAQHMLTISKSSSA